MTIGNTTENAILDLVFRGTAWANYADPAASANQANIGMSLHTADPGETGDASTSEVTTGAYAGYTRMNVLRSTGWAAAVAGQSFLAANLDFPAGTGGTGASVTFFAAAKSLATPPTGTMAILWSGSVTPPITVGNGVTPRLTTGTHCDLD